MTIPRSRPRIVPFVALAASVLLWGLSLAPALAVGPPPDPSIQAVFHDLEAALKSRNFSRFDTGKAEEKPISWGVCNLTGGDHITFDAAVKKLKALSSNAMILINENTTETLGIVSIETKGWPGENPYIYFGFQVTFQGWRGWAFGNARVGTTSFACYRARKRQEQITQYLKADLHLRSRKNER